VSDETPDPILDKRVALSADTTTCPKCGEVAGEAVVYQEGVPVRRVLCFKCEVERIKEEGL
jgi:hypothetical protein